MADERFTLLEKGGVAGDAAGKFELRLGALVYGDRVAAPAAAIQRVVGNRVEYLRGGVTECYIREAHGVEQGFTLRENAPHNRGERLRLNLAVSGELKPVLRGDRIELQRDGKTALSYSQLRAWDTNGRELESHRETRDNRILLSVDDWEAPYPVTIDPFLQQQEIIPADGKTIDQFGGAVTISGNNVIPPSGGLAGIGIPDVSTLNYYGNVVANAAIVPSGSSGAINVFVNYSTDVLFDINGYFAP
jgi:hypothetical protein